MLIRGNIEIDNSFDFWHLIDILRKKETDTFFVIGNFQISPAMSRFAENRKMGVTTVFKINIISLSYNLEV